MIDGASVFKFVKHNRVRAKKGFICVDGRYPAGDKTAGMLARPGGNFRGIMVLLALRKKLGLTVGQAVDRAIEAVESMGTSFNMHTDEHTNANDLGSIGCGHIALATDPEFSSMYKVEADDVKKALVYLRIKLEGRKYYQMINLAGTHKEQGVLVIQGAKYTLNHYDPQSDQMFFVFDKARDIEYLRQLYGAVRLPKLTYKEFVELSDIQLNATLMNLAKGLPIYEVNADDIKPKIRFIGKVE